MPKGYAVDNEATRAETMERNGMPEATKGKLVASSVVRNGNDVSFEVEKVSVVPGFRGLTAESLAPYRRAYNERRGAAGPDSESLYESVVSSVASNVASKCGF